MDGLYSSFNRVDKELISYALKKTHWNRARAATMLNVSYKLLYNKIDELYIRPPEFELRGTIV